MFKAHSNGASIVRMVDSRFYRNASLDPLQDYCYSTMSIVGERRGGMLDVSNFYSPKDMEIWYDSKGAGTRRSDIRFLHRVYF